MQWHSRLRSLWRGLISRSQVEAEMDEELHYHIELRARDLVAAGVAPKEAARRARLEFGSVESVKELGRESRGLHVVDAILRDSRYALRRLVRDPRFSLTAAATLAIGIGVTASVFALVNAVLIRPLPYPDSDRLVAVGHAAPGIEAAKTGLSGGTYMHYQNQNRTFENIATYVEEFYTVSDPAAPESTPEFVRVARSRPRSRTSTGSSPYCQRRTQTSPRNGSKRWDYAPPSRR